MSILFLKTGVLTTVQDLGRNNFRRAGINPNGAMDEFAARAINILLGNDEGAGVLEMHFPAPELEFEAAADFALGGADFGATLDGAPIENWRWVFAEKGAVLKFPRRLSGARIYLAVRGGFALEKWLNSYSTNLIARFGGFDGRALEKGDRLFYNQRPKTKDQGPKSKISHNFLPPYSSAPTIRVTAGAEFENLTATSQIDFQSEKFTVRPDSNRMGFRLGGAELKQLETAELVSSAVNFGTIQLLPDGQMIILMADAQTHGGYPRLAHVAAVDLPLLAQLNPNDRINFKLISLAAAENLRVRFESDLSLLKLACQSIWNQ